MTKRMLSLVMVLAMVLSLFAGLTIAHADDVYYTLDGTVKGSNNSYAGNCDIEVNSMTWNVEGNAQMAPWRIGGKKLSSVARNVYSKTAMGSAISKVDLTVTNVTCTVDSFSMIVASDADFTNVLDTVSGTITANSTITLQPTSGDSWATGAYYKFVFTVTCGGSNQYVNLSKAEFYAGSDSSGGHVHSYGDWYSNNDGTHSRDCDDPDGDCTVPTETADCTYGDPVVVAATCSATGSFTETCTVCGYQKVTVLDIDPNAHTDSDNDGVCDNCGEDMPAQLPEITGDIVFADLGLENGVQYTDPFTSSNGAFTVTFAGGANDGKYYNTGTGIRVYGGGTMTVAATTGTITSIKITCASGNVIVANTSDVGTLTVDGTVGTWTGSANSVVFTRPSGSGHWRIQKVEVTVVTDGNVHVHSYGDWYSNNDGTHSRDCDDPDGDCTVPTETANCTYGEAVVVPATCSATGTSTQTCTVCGYQKVTVLDIDPNAHADENNDGVCDLCGEDMPQVETYTLNDELHDGDKVVIYHPTSGNAISVNASGTKLAAVAVSPSNGELVVEDANVAIFTVEFVDATNFKLIDQNGNYLTSGQTGNSLSLGAESDTLSQWYLSTLGSSKVGIRSTGANYNGNYNQALEYYNGFTTYGWKDNNNAYIFELYTIVNASAHEHTWDAGTETTAATCTAEGVMTYTCTECGETKTEPIPMLAHADANDDGLCDACGGTIYTLATTLNEGDSVVIYHPVSKTALTGTATSNNRLVAEAVNVNGGLAVTSSSSIAVLTVDYLEGSTTDFYLKSGDSYLTTGETGNSLTLEAEATNYSVWTLDTSSGSALIVNANAAYTSGENTYPIAVEYYGGNFNGYSWKNNGDTAFYVELYTKAAAPAEVKASYSLTTGAKIGINLYFENLPDGATVEVNGAAVTLDSNNCYTIEVAAKDYATEYTVTVNGGATQVNGTDSLKVSVPSYIAAEDEDQSKTDSGVGTVADVVKAMSNFCYYSATYFGKTPSGSLYNDVFDAIGNVTYNADTFAAISANDIEVPTIATAKDSSNDTVITFYGASLVLESETTLRFYFKTGDTEANDLAATDVTVKGGECAKTGKQGAYVYVDVKVAAKDLANGISVSVNYNGQTAEITNYAATSYIKQVLGKTNANENLVNTLKALYVYYLTAFAYFG